MKRLFTGVRYIAFGVLLVMIGGLGGWYVYLKNQETNVATVSAGRGLNEPTPSFSGNTGSSDVNIHGQPISNVVSQRGKPPRLWHVSENAVSGAHFFTDGSSTVLYFVDRATGHIVKAAPGSGVVARITNSLYPHVEEAYFISTSTVVLRRLTDGGGVETMVGRVTAGTSSSEGELKLSALPPDIRALSVSPSGKNLFYLVAKPSGGVSGVLTDQFGGNPKAIFSSALFGWNLSWNNAARITLTQKGADDILGNAYSLSPSGALSSLVTGVSGLQVASASSSTFLYSSAGNGSVSLFIKHATTSAALAAEVQTFAEKCTVLSSLAYCGVPSSIPVGEPLNEWYRGDYHTSDVLSEISLTTGAGTVIAALPTDYNVNVDITHLIASSGNDYLAFQDGGDGTLYVFRFAQ